MFTARLMLLKTAKDSTERLMIAMINGHSIKTTE